MSLSPRDDSTFFLYSPLAAVIPLLRSDLAALYRALSPDLKAEFLNSRGHPWFLVRIDPNMLVHSDSVCTMLNVTQDSVRAFLELLVFEYIPVCVLEAILQLVNSSLRPDCDSPCHWLGFLPEGDVGRDKEQGEVVRPAQMGEGNSLICLFPVGIDQILSVLSSGGTLHILDKSR